MTTTNPTVEPERAGDRLDPAGMRSDQDQAALAAERALIGRSCKFPVLLFLGSSVFWLIIGTILALLASIKLHSPDFLADWSFLTFGRVRPAHLDIVAFGWSAMVGLAWRRVASSWHHVISWWIGRSTAQRVRHSAPCRW